VSENKKVIGPRSLERDLLVRVIEGPPGTHFSYEDLEEACGRDVRSSSPQRWCLDGALRDVQRERSEVWQRVGDGIRRLSDDEVPYVRGLRRVKSIRKTAQRIARDLRCTTPAGMTPEARTASNAAVSVAGVILLFTAKPAQKKVAEICAEVPQPSLKVLEIFRSKTP